MSRRTRFFLAVVATLAVGALAASLVIASGGSGGATSSKAAKGFTPAKVAGKWTGTWENTKFGSTGEIRVNVKPKSGNKLLFLADFGGLVFGCSDPPAVAVTVPKGKKGPNRWDSSGFRFANKPTQAFGSLSLTYNYRTKSLKGSGSGPPCRPEITYTVEGTLKPAAFSGKVNIDLGTENAITVLSATK